MLFLYSETTGLQLLLQQDWEYQQTLPPAGGAWIWHMDNVLGVKAANWVIFAVTLIVYIIILTTYIIYIYKIK